MLTIKIFAIWDKTKEDKTYLIWEFEMAQKKTKNKIY